MSSHGASHTIEAWYKKIKIEASKSIIKNVTKILKHITLYCLDYVLSTLPSWKQKLSFKIS